MIFIMHIFINLNTAYYHKGSIEVLDRKMIIQKYLNENFIFDVFSLIPLFIN